MTDDLAEVLFQTPLCEAIVSSPGMGRDVHSDVVHPALPLPTSPTLQVTLACKDIEITIYIIKDQFI